METKQEIKFVRNFATFTAKEGKKVRVITDGNGNETGFEVDGMLTTFDLVNANGMAFRSESYDRFVTDYFQRNDLNVPVCLDHIDNDIRLAAGHVSRMEKTADGVVMTAFVPRYAYYYDLIKSMIEGGDYQGFSNCGGVAAGEWDEQGNLVISDFELLHVAIVRTPADATATFSVANTRFKGFTPEGVENKKEKEQPKEEAAGDDWRDIV